MNPVATPMLLLVERAMKSNETFPCPRCGTQLCGVDDLFVNFNNTIKEIFTGLEHTTERCTAYWSAKASFRRTYEPDIQRDRPPEKKKRYIKR